MNVKFSYGTTRPGDQPIFVSDNSKFAAATGWNAGTDVHTGIKKLLSWLQENKEQLVQFYA